MNVILFLLIQIYMEYLNSFEESLHIFIDYGPPACCVSTGMPNTFLTTKAIL